MNIGTVPNMVLPGNRIDGDTIDSHNLLPPGLSELRRNANKETFMFLWMPIFPAAITHLLGNRETRKEDLQKGDISRSSRSHQRTKLTTKRREQKEIREDFHLHQYQFFLRGT